MPGEVNVQKERATLAGGAYFGATGSGLRQFRRCGKELHPAPALGVGFSVAAVGVELIAVAHLLETLFGEPRRRGDVARASLAGNGAVEVIDQLPCLQVQGVGDVIDWYCPVRMGWNADPDPSQAATALGDPVRDVMMIPTRLVPGETV